MADPSKLVGRYKLQKSKNFDEYMKGLGVGFAMRAIGNAVKNTVEIAINGDEWTLRTISTLKTTEQKFKLGEEFAEETMDGRKCKTTFTFEDGKLVQRQLATKAGEKNSDLIREVVGDKEMLTTLLLHDPPLTCKRYYTRET